MDMKEFFKIPQQIFKTKKKTSKETTYFWKEYKKFLTRLLVVSENEDHRTKAKRVANKVRLLFAGELAEVLTDKYTNKKDGKYLEDRYLLVVSEDKIYLKKGSTATSKPIFCDFLKWSKGNKRNNLVRAMQGLPRKGVIVDATAGFGRDALILSPLVKRVILIDRLPWMAALLEDGLKNSREQLPYLSNTKVISYESENYLLHVLKTKPDAIYLDPMFENTGKSKAKREVQALRDLTIQTNGEDLLEAALKKAKDRVVIKRHRKGKYLAGIKPTYSITGRVVRYDVYSIS